MRAWGRLGLSLAGALAGATVGAGSVAAQPSSEPFELVPGSFRMQGSTSQAGAHEDLTTEFDLAHSPASGHTHNDMRTAVVNLPAGFMASNTAVPTCTFDQLEAQAGDVLEHAEAQAPYGGTANECPPASQVGTITFDLTGFNGVAATQRTTFPLYNMQTSSYGVTAELGYRADLITNVLLVKVRPGDSGLTVTSPNIETIGEPRAIKVVTWGVPADPSHDAERGLECFDEGGNGRPNAESGGAECFNGGETVNVAPRPFLANPTSCGAFTASMEADSWEHPEEWSHAEAQVGPIAGCERVHFDPGLKVLPTTTAAESPSGLDLSLEVPQTWESPFSLATSTLKDTKVTLPLGYTVNPSAGNGLLGCNPAQYEAETASSAPGAGCPAESKLGKVTIETPVLGEQLTGNVYLAQPYENPFGSLLAMYVVAKAPDRGIVIKAAGKVEPDPVTGQLVTTFPNTPQQPFNRLTLELRQGQTSPLVSPPLCGTYGVDAQLTPWSAPEEPRFIHGEFSIERGIGGGPCPAGGAPPFSPKAVAGTATNTAGAYSPFYLRLERQDGEQELTGFSTVMPPGLTGNLTGIPFCPDAAIEAARARTGEHGGAEELAAPSCPAASRVGHTIVEAGVGAVLAQTPGSLYLAGPFNGAPLSLVSITSATVGPFDLGTVVIRFALNINPTTAQVEVSPTGSEPIPHIIKGIVTHVRDIRAYIDRPGFILNPTSCERMATSNVVTGAGADPSNPAAWVPMGVSSPFQAADCANLKYTPQLSVTTTGRASRLNGTSLTFRIAYPKGAVGTQSWFKSAQFDIPKQLPARLTTIQQACLAATFESNRAACPPASIIGHALVHTPILPVPLEGPVYFVSYGGAKFPDAVLVLKGYGITIELHGHTFINSKTSVTSATFESLPDVPFESIEVSIPQGRYSEFGANLPHESYNFCGQKLTVPNLLKASNGLQISQNTPVAVTGCSTKISISSHRVRGNTLTLTVYAPGPGRLTASARGLSSASKRTSGIEFVTLTLKAKRRGKFRTKLHLTFAPSRGRHQSDALTLRV